MKRFLCSLIVLIGTFVAGVTAAQDPFVQLKEETLSYFKPLRGTVISVTGRSLLTDLGTGSGIRNGMRFSVLREGAPFLHPVTKEPIGKVESFVGSAVVREVGPEGSHLEVISGEVREGDLVRISETKVRMFFYQDRQVDWALSEYYYRMLKESGRFELIVTSLDSGDDAVVLEEARKKQAQVALLLRAEGTDHDAGIAQMLLWVEDGMKIFDRTVKADAGALKGLPLGEGLLPPLLPAADALLFFDLPFSGKLVASGDVNGDGNREIIITTGRDIRILGVGASLQSLYEITGRPSDEYLWIDAFDIDGDGKDELLLTSMRDGDIFSAAYRLGGSEFSLLWKGGFFLRRLGNELIGQEYEKGEGYRGPVFTLRYEQGEFKKGAAMNLPKGVNLYDFQVMEGLDGKRHVLAYDDSSLLSLYNADGLKVWSGREDYGGFLTTFKKNAPTVMADRGSWSVKDRLLSRNREVLVVKRLPLAAMAKGLGYKSSQIQSLFWTGLSMEERVLIDGVSGALLDVAIDQDRLVVLSRPLFGVKAKNILKGESPLGSMLYIYSLKGR